MKHAFVALQRAARKHLKPFQGRPIGEEDFDLLTADLLADPSLALPGILYGRHGLVSVHEIAPYTFQTLGFQINSFPAGAMGPEPARFCTPILLTVQVHGAHPYLNLRDSLVSLDALYLGRHYSGSKGALCDRDRFFGHLKTLMAGTRVHSYSHRVAWQLMKMNQICHHMSETLAYLCGALSRFWSTGQTLFCLVSGSRYAEKQGKLAIVLEDDFGRARMRNEFEIQDYRLLDGAPEALQEPHDSALWRVTYKDDLQLFSIPSGYQKKLQKIEGKSVNVVTTQSIVDHVLSDYFKRENAFVVSNTFQVLEHLSRAIWAKKQGCQQEGGRFLKLASSCLGHYPENDFQAIMAGQESRYEVFAGDYAYATFFRSPIAE